MTSILFLTEQFIATFADVIISKTKNFFPNFFVVFSKITLNFEPFQKKDDPHSRFIFELTGSERRGWINV